jgi:hypothetical protein
LKYITRFWIESRTWSGTMLGGWELKTFFKNEIRLSPENQTSTSDWEHSCKTKLKWKRIASQFKRIDFYSLKSFVTNKLLLKWIFKTVLVHKGIYKHNEQR